MTRGQRPTRIKDSKDIPGVLNLKQSIIGNPIDQWISIKTVSQLISIDIGQSMAYQKSQKSSYILLISSIFINW